MLSLLLFTLAAAVDANARDESTRATAGESWFGTDGLPESTQPVAPSMPTAADPAPAAPQSVAPFVHQNGPQGSQSQTRERAAGPVSPVRYEPDDPSVQLLVQNGTMPMDSLMPYNAPGWWGWPQSYGYYRAAGEVPIYTPLCAGPCMTQVRRGDHQFALSKPGGAIVPVLGTGSILEPSLIQAHYVDRSTQRTAGVLIGVVGALGGLVMIAASVRDDQRCDGSSCYSESRLDEGWTVAGLGVFAGSIVTSIVLLNQSDEAQLSISPLWRAPTDPRHDALHSLNRTSSPQGAMATLQF